MPKHETKLRRM